jgi:inosose dehydratase
VTIGSKVAYNPLPWIWTREQFDVSEAAVLSAVSGTAEAGFAAIHADIPLTMSAQRYLELVGEAGLVPAPGYIAAHLDATGTELDAELAHARLQARKQREIGVTEVLLASHLCPPRVDRPGIGADFEASRFQRVVDVLRRIAETIAEEGVRPCLHPHVGTWIETPDEVEHVLETIDADVLGLGPDTGHLAWSGSDLQRTARDHASRIGVVHVKDAHLDAVARCLDAGDDFFTTLFDRGIWAEPGYGDIDLSGFLDQLPPTFPGWIVIETDVPDGCTKEESAARARAWAAAQGRRFA